MLLFAMLWAMGSASAQSCMPKFKLQAEWVACAADADCRVTGDACRSCGTPPVVNKKYHEAFIKADNAARQAAGCVLACEACGTAHVKVRCVAGRCEARR